MSNNVPFVLNGMKHFISSSFLSVADKLYRFKDVKKTTLLLDIYDRRESAKHECLGYFKTTVNNLTRGVTEGE